MTSFAWAYYAGGYVMVLPKMWMMWETPGEFLADSMILIFVAVFGAASYVIVYLMIRRGLMNKKQYLAIVCAAAAAVAAILLV